MSQQSVRQRADKERVELSVVPAQLGKYTAIEVIDQRILDRHRLVTHRGVVHQGGKAEALTLSHALYEITFTISQFKRAATDYMQLVVFATNVEHIVAGTVIADLHRGGNGMRLGRGENVESGQGSHEARNFRQFVHKLILTCLAAT